MFPGWPSISKHLRSVVISNYPVSYDVQKFAKTVMIFWSDHKLVFVRFATDISPPLHCLSSGEKASMCIEHIKHGELLSEIASHKAPHFCNAQDLISCADNIESACSWDNKIENPWLWLVHGVDSAIEICNRIVGCLRGVILSYLASKKTAPRHYFVPLQLAPGQRPWIIWLLCQLWPELSISRKFCSIFL